MAYSPNNVAIYLSAMLGAAAGVGVNFQPQSAAPASYLSVAQRADAFAQAVDQAWGAQTSTTFENQLVSELAQTIWASSWPQLSAATVNLSASYAQMAAAITALSQECNTQVVGEGINPNALNTGLVQTLSANSGPNVGLVAGLTVLLTQTVTVGVGQKVLAFGTCNILDSTAGGGVARAQITVAGAGNQQPSTVTVNSAGDESMPVMASLTLSPGTYVIGLGAQQISGTGALQAYNNTLVLFLVGV